MRLIIKNIIYLSLTVSLFVQLPVLAKNQTDDERLFKAAYIYNFAKFTRWPDSSQKNPPLILCTVGNDDLVDDLKRLGGKVIKGRRLTVLQVDKKNYQSSCNLLYIAVSEKKRVSRILKNAQKQPVLTISMLQGFEKNGGMVQLYTSKGKTRILINLLRVRKAGLEVSSRLLMLAKVTGSEDLP